MRRLPFFFLLLFFLVLVGCEARVALYAPRRMPTEDHLRAATPGDCRDCHDTANLLRHKADDDCLSCHKLCKGC